jgi:hypothetical protein
VRLLIAHFISVLYFRFISLSAPRHPLSAQVFHFITFTKVAISPATHILVLADFDVIILARCEKLMILATDELFRHSAVS